MTPARSANLVKLAAELAEPEPVARELELVAPELAAPELAAPVAAVPVVLVAEPAVGVAADKIAKLNPFKRASASAGALFAAACGGLAYGRRA
jgi:hypothetical protein